MIFTGNSNDIHLMTVANLHTNTCACIPELGQKCWLDAPDSLLTQIQKRESEDETNYPSPTHSVCEDMRVGVLVS